MQVPVSVADKFLQSLGTADEDHRLKARQTRGELAVCDAVFLIKIKYARTKTWRKRKLSSCKTIRIM